MANLLERRQVLPASGGIALGARDARGHEVADDQRIRRASVADTGQVPLQHRRGVIQCVRFVEHQHVGNIQQ
ncbi:hypothetical protein D3C80_641700 [compost metagenome]